MYRRPAHHAIGSTACVQAGMGPAHYSPYGGLCCAVAHQCCWLSASVCALQPEEGLALCLFTPGERWTLTPRTFAVRCMSVTLQHVLAVCVRVSRPFEVGRRRRIAVCAGPPPCLCPVPVDAILSGDTLGTRSSFMIEASSSTGLLRGVYSCEINKECFSLPTFRGGSSHGITIH